MNPTGILIVAAIAIALIIALRELMCWYSKINERIELQKETNKLLGKILIELKPVPKEDPNKLLTV